MLSGPRVILHSKADDVHGRLRRDGAQLLAEVARRGAAGLLAVGQNDDHPGLLAIVQDVGSFGHGCRDRCLACGRQRVEVAHDLACSICGRLEIEPDVALLARAWAIGDEADAADLATVRRTSASAERTSSIRGLSVAIPPSRLPDIEPEASNTMFFIISGEVRVTIYSLAGKVVSFRELGPGEVFGEYPAIDRGPRSASVEARSSCLVATLPGAAFRE